MNDRWFPKQANIIAMHEIIFVRNNGVLKYGKDSVTEPFNFYKDGKVVGFDIELAHHVSKKLSRTHGIVGMV